MEKVPLSPSWIEDLPCFYKKTKIMESIYFLNGNYLPSSKTLLPINDLGFIRGYGVFDFMRTYNQKPFLIDDHLERLYQSAESIDLIIPWSKDQIKSWILKTLSQNSFPESAIRIIITGGLSLDNLSPSKNPTIAILVEKASCYNQIFYKQGVKLSTYPLRRVWSKSKTLNYIPAVIIHQLALNDGFFDGIYLDTNKNILEASNSNLFFLINNRLITPCEGILFGITRKVVIDLCKNLYPIIERKINFQELSNISECFLTSSSKEIVPVVGINRTFIGDGKVGSTTKKIMQLFHQFTASY